MDGRGGAERERAVSCNVVAVEVVVMEGKGKAGAGMGPCRKERLMSSRETPLQWRGEVEGRCRARH